VLFVGTIRLAKSLAHNEKVERDRAVKKLKVFIRDHPQTEMNLMKIFKGIFYCKHLICYVVLAVKQIALVAGCSVDLLTRFLDV
jgi:hypothetical protein